MEDIVLNGSLTFYFNINFTLNGHNVTFDIANNLYGISVLNGSSLNVSGGILNFGTGESKPRGFLVGNGKVSLIGVNAKSYNRFSTVSNLSYGKEADSSFFIDGNSEITADIANGEPLFFLRSEDFIKIFPDYAEKGYDLSKANKSTITCNGKLICNSSLGE